MVKVSTLELKEKLNEYIELKNWCEEYNKKQIQDGLDLGARIILDIVKTYPYQIEGLEIKWEDNWKKQNLILRFPYGNNDELKTEIKNYIVERYPNTKKHYLGIVLAVCIPLKSIDDFMMELKV